MRYLTKCLPSTPSRRPGMAARCLLVLSALLLAACRSTAPVASHDPPVGDGPAPRTPVIVVPGVLGSMLRIEESGKVIWGRGLNTLLPRDRGHALALPLAAAEEADDGVEAFSVVDEVRLATVRRVVYRVLADYLVDRGRRLGDIQRPGAGDDLFFFHYDWRRPNSASARRLLARLEAIRRARGVERLPVHLICQSNGAYLCRWLIKYGGGSLEEAAAGRGALPDSIRVERLILVGTANGGSLRTLRELNRGRRFVGPPFGRVFRPETLFSLRSLFEDLPACRRDLFLDAEGKLLDVDLYDAESWVRYGWSVFDPRLRRRLGRKGLADLFADEELRRRYLEERLRAARRFQELLARDVPGFGSVRYHLVQNVSAPTPERAVLLREEEGWRTLFTGDRELEGLALDGPTTALGDGHATVESQLCLSPQERAVVVGETFESAGEHFDMILEEPTLAHLAELVGVGPSPSEPGQDRVETAEP